MVNGKQNDATIKCPRSLTSWCVKQHTSQFPHTSILYVHFFSSVKRKHQEVVPHEVLVNLFFVIKHFPLTLAHQAYHVHQSITCLLKTH